MKIDKKYLPIVIVVALIMLVFVAKVPYSLVGENTAGQICTVTGNIMTCNVNNRAFNPTGNPDSYNNIYIEGLSSVARQRGFEYNKCKVTSLLLTVIRDTGGSYQIPASDLNTPYDATGDSCPIHFSSWITNPSVDSQASFSSTVMFYKESQICTNIPTKPCDQAVWNDYPTCQWNTASCTAPVNNMYILAGVAGLSLIGLYLFYNGKRWFK